MVHPTLKDVYTPEREGQLAHGALGRLQNDREAYEACMRLMKLGVGPITFSLLFGMVSIPCAVQGNHPPTCVCWGLRVVPSPLFDEPPKQGGAS